MTIRRVRVRCARNKCLSRVVQPELRTLTQQRFTRHAIRELNNHRLKPVGWGCGLKFRIRVA